MPGEIDNALRAEIVECQKAKAEFIRWKLIIVAAIGGAAFGLNDTVGQPALMALIPLVCIYVDSVCVHNDSRIMMIADFLRTSDHAGAQARAYEAHCNAHRHRFYGDGMVLFVSSFVLSVLVAAWGIYERTVDEPFAGAACLVTGIVGGIVTLILVRNFRLIQEGEQPFQIVRLGMKD
jgi:hypothetical protein